MPGRPTTNSAPAMKIAAPSAIQPSRDPEVSAMSDLLLANGAASGSAGWNLQENHEVAANHRQSGDTLTHHD
jgi:hypothetical protein